MKTSGRAFAALASLPFVIVSCALCASPAVLRERAGNGHAGSLRRMVTRVSNKHGLDPRLVHALVRVESGYDPRAVSSKGALGLMQIMPETARRLHVKHPFDPEENVDAGVRELGRLIDRYVGDLPRALAAYNAGEGAVERYRGIPPFRETRNYVARIMTLYTGHRYRLPATSRGRPVRLVHDSRSGEVVITNTGREGSVPTLLNGGFADRSGSSALGGVLGGGFGRNPSQNPGSAR